MKSKQMQKSLSSKKIISSFGKMSKQWGLGKPVGKIWGFLLFNSIPLTQKEIGDGVNYSRGLVSRSLKQLKELDMLSETRKGKEFYYSTNTSLIKGFDNVVKNFLEKEIRPVIKYLSESSKDIEDIQVKKNIQKMAVEYKKLNLGILVFSKVMEGFASLNTESIRTIAQKYSVKL